MMQVIYNLHQLTGCNQFAPCCLFIFLIHIKLFILFAKEVHNQNVSHCCYINIVMIQFIKNLKETQIYL